MKKVLTFGSLNMDLSIYTDRIPNNGETIQGKDFFLSPGGKGGNQAVAAAKSGANTWIAGAVSTDLYGNKLVETLTKYNVNCDYIKMSRRITTGIAMIIRNDGDNRIILDKGANNDVDFQDVNKMLQDIGRPGDIFLTQFENDYETTLHALKAAKKKGLFTILNPAPAKHITKANYLHIDLLIINQSECEFLSGIYPSEESEYRKAIQYFQQQGVHAVLITLGAEGSIVGDGTTIHFVPGLSVNTVDTTAAGDTYIGALACELSHGKTIQKSMEYATCAAALTVSKAGAQKSIPTRQDIIDSKYVEE